jgi:hypothetical protein
MKTFVLRTFALLLFFVSPAFAGGPLFKSKERFTQMEFDNVYQDLRGKQSSIPFMTKAQLQAATPLAANLFFICTDCTTDGLVISTGTTVGAVGRATAKTTSIN